ncbi:hypothetical protein ACQPYK_17880 [Streptosporangium sp. CA-135522]|uniref:hypothetical protein n=1 Tax=Streptosporangium sp. CA-135522 TaxID=3240072 RepID=UPI003D8AE48D
MGIWQGPEGIEVEAIMLDDLPFLRVTQPIGGQRMVLAYCMDVREVERLVDLAKLVAA